MLGAQWVVDLTINLFISFTISWFQFSYGSFKKQYICSFEININWELNIWSSIDVKAVIDHQTIVVHEEDTKDPSETPAANKLENWLLHDDLLPEPPENILEESSWSYGDNNGEDQQGGELVSLIISFHLFMYLINFFYLLL